MDEKQILTNKTSSWICCKREKNSAKCNSESYVGCFVFEFVDNYDDDNHAVDMIVFCRLT